MTFHDDEHRINNTGWIRNGDGTEEWNEKQNHREDAERFSIYIFSIRNEACLEFAFAKLRGLRKYLADAYNSKTVMSADSTVLLLSTKTKQESQRNEASHLSENALKKAQRYLT